ncbi:MAG: hypothetical protein K2N94_05925 [Lachnospiraceae bacterium]|nr:hypothetical protein [Lachnospiraceae bacterium]
MSEEKDTKSRKWLLTINNPEEKGYTNETIEEKVQSFASFRYAAYSHEVGCENHVYHIHIFLAFDSAVRFSTIKNTFPEAHIDKCKGSIKDNRDYVFKAGKWSGSEKEDSKIEGMQFEIGTAPIEVGQGHRTDIDRLEEMIDAGLTPEQIFALSMSYRMYERQIRAQYMAKRQRETPLFRQVKTIWHVGESGTGKSYSMLRLMEEQPESVYLMNDYDGGGLDLYQGESVLFMDEFRGQIRYSTLLNMLDGYRTQVHCRYANVYALWTEVHITSVLPPEAVYSKMVEERKDIDTIQQLLRRLNEVHYHYRQNGEYRVFVQPAEQYKDYEALQTAVGADFKQCEIEWSKLK